MSQNPEAGKSGETAAAPSEEGEESRCRKRQRRRLERARNWWLHGRGGGRVEEGGGDLTTDVNGASDGSLDDDREPCSGEGWLEAVHRKVWETSVSARSPDGEGIGGSDCCPTPEQALAGERLALLLLQSPSRTGERTRRREEADAILDRLGYTCRLARGVFDYPPDDEPPSSSVAKEPKTSTPIPSSPASLTCPCVAFDGFLPQHLLEHLQRVFCDPRASYWTDHRYRVEPHPTPYFSYVLPLPPAGGFRDPAQVERFEADFGGLASVIALVRRALAEWKGSTVAASASSCEMWAHCRPGCTGHQLHWDTDNEGRDAKAIRHPVATAILCLQPGLGGGPTLVTHQRLAATCAVPNGWLVTPTENRLLLMDGRVLHGVVPGKLVVQPGRAESSPRPARVTLMLAFWKRIRVRGDEPGPGAARPFPVSPLRRPEWAERLASRATPDASHSTPPRRPVQPTPVQHVYERVPGGEPWSAASRGGAPPPAYDRVFQGI